MRIIDYIVCDDIRFEHNNKLTLVGTYTDRMEFLSKKSQPVTLPANYSLGFYIKAELTDKIDFKDVKDLFLRLDFFLNSKELKTVKLNIFHLSVLESHPIIVPYVDKVFPLDKGELRFVLSIFRRKELIAKSEPSEPFYVVVKEESSPEAS